MSHLISLKYRIFFLALLFIGFSSVGHAETADEMPANVVRPQACERICGEIEAFLKRDFRNIKIEVERWSERLSLKSDVVTYLRGETAAEGLLKFMARSYVARAPENQMEIEFLTLLMNKCFPQAIVDIDSARLSELVKILWAAKSLDIKERIHSCK